MKRPEEKLIIPIEFIEIYKKERLKHKTDFPLENDYDFFLRKGAMKKRGKDYIVLRYSISSIPNYVTVHLKNYVNLFTEEIFTKCSTASGGFVPMDFWMKLKNKVQ